jgi:hypothetical protein
MALDSTSGYAAAGPPALLSPKAKPGKEEEREAERR